MYWHTECNIAQPGPEVANLYLPVWDARNSLVEGELLLQFIFPKFLSMFDSLSLILEANTRVHTHTYIHTHIYTVYESLSFKLGAGKK